MHVILYMAQSVNGVIAGSDGNEDFLSHYNWETLERLTKVAGCLIWGRKAYETVVSWGPKYVDSLGGVKKIIVSKRKGLALSPDCLAASAPEEALKIAEEQKFDKVILSGGSTLNAAFAKAGLIDEIILNIEPAAIGQGIPLFKPEDFELNLELLSADRWPENGGVTLRYNVRK